MKFGKYILKYNYCQTFICNILNKIYIYLNIYFIVHENDDPIYFEVLNFILKSNNKFVKSLMLLIENWKE